MADVRGRYPGPLLLRPETMRPQLYLNSDGRLTVRIDDRYHPDFWMEVTFTQEEVATAQALKEAL